MRLFVLARHGQSTLNVEMRVNGDPAVPVALTRAGIEQAMQLGSQLESLGLDLCLHTRFVRTLRTAEIALDGRGVALREEPGLDDVALGELEGCTIEEYRAWKRGRPRSEPFPGGESLDDAARRYARACRALLEGEARAVLVICHEIPVRYAVNAALGSDSLDGPVHDIGNATPFVFDEAGLERAVAGIERLSG